MTKVYYTTYKDEKKQSQAGKALLDFVLREYYNIDDLSLCCTELGKPYLEGDTVHISISHSGGLAVIAVSDDEVGVDVEPMRDIRPGVIRRFWGKDISEPLDRLLAWLERESYGKMTGEGFAVSEPYAVHYYRHYDVSHDGRKFYICVCSPTEEFSSCLTPCSVPLP